jgi:hypothetical protein
VEVCGEVPGPAVRQLALQMARAHATVPMTDWLKVNPALGSRSVGGDAAVLRDRAAELLAQAYPGQVRQMSVRAQADGHLTVTGTVASPEDRLAVSRLMCRLVGCSCVTNQLEVAGPTAADRPTSKGPAAPAVSQAALHTTRPLPPVTPAKAEEPAAGPPRVVQAAAHEPSPLPSELLPRGQAAVPAPRDAGLPAVVTPPAPLSDPARAVAPLAPPRGTEPAGRPQEKAAPGGDGYVSTGVLVRHAEDPAPAPPGPAAAEGYVSTGVVVRSGERAAPPSRQTQPAVRPDVPYAAVGGPAVARANPPLDVPKVKRRIESACGRAARAVDVVPLPGNGVEVRLKVASAEEADKLLAKVVGLPELAPCQVSFQIELDR